MLSDAVRHVQAVVDLMASGQFTDDEIEEKVLDWTGDELMSRRLIDWIPEVFGLLVVGHLDQFNLDPTFQVKSASGEWRTFDITSEPIVEEAGKIAAAMFHDAAGARFRSIASRSSLVDAANRALKTNPRIKSTLSGPAFIGIPAHVYADMDG